MCNACGFSCCASDSFDGCGCDCDVTECRISRCGGCGEWVDATYVDDDCACFRDESMVDLGGGMVVPLRELMEDD